MGLDSYIEARIKEKQTGRVVSSGEDEEYTDEEDIGFMEICWWCSWSFCDIREKMVEICNKHAGTNYKESDFVIPIPQSALREIYGLIVSRSFMEDDENSDISSCNIDWKKRYAYEKMNLENAVALNELLWILTAIENNEESFVDWKYIPDEKDQKLFKENPNNYQWEFRMYNSY